MNKRYYIFNQPYTKDEYFKKIKEWDLGSHEGYETLKHAAHKHWKKYPPKPIWMDLSVNSTGNYTFESKNCKECYEVQSAQDSKYLNMMILGPVRDCYDVVGWGNDLELSYECAGVGEHASQMRFCCDGGINAYDAEYCKLVTGGGHYFGCVSVKKGEYVILNKKYSKREYETLKAKIVAQMKEAGEYGEFFPINISPHAYNETLAQSFFPLKKEEAEKKGYRWQEQEPQEYKITLRATELSDHISDATDLLLKQVIGCEKCGRGYRITPMELQFLRQMRLPLPHRYPFCRIDEKFQAWIKQMQLTDCTCNTCKKSFRTPYTSDEYPTILCKECWTNEYN